MGAKASVFVLAALAAGGCADGLKRFAPPGIVKYEELAKDEPMNPAIVSRIEEAKAAEGGGFPALAEQPTAVPQGIAKPEREAMQEALLAGRDDLNAAVEEDRILAAAERDGSIEGLRDALGEEVAKDDAAARRERGLPPRAVQDAEEKGDEAEAAEVD
jgi:hypothetical protein